MPRFLPALLLPIGATLCFAALAQTAAPADELTQVTVVGATPYGTIDQPAAQIAGAVQGASSAQIEGSHAADLTAFLNRRLGGVYVNDLQNNPLQPDVNYRGYTASPLLGTPQGLSVYVDGLRLNQPFGDVVSWDLIPRAAIQRLELVSGASPLFGTNSLGGALSLHTKDGYSAPGTVLQLTAGSHDRRQLEAQTGGHTDAGLYWYATANRFRDAGWRVSSPSDATQAFGKLGWRDAATDVSLSAAAADTDLNGNGLQDFRLLAQDPASAYTKPDNTRNRSGLLNVTARHDLDNGLNLSGNAWYRNLNTTTYNGDINEAALGGNVYAAGETALDTPFPSASCLTQALLNEAPNETCNGLINRTTLSQHNSGIALQLQLQGEWGGRENRLTAGLVIDESRSHFQQDSQFAYLTPDHGVVGVTGAGAFADGSRVDLGGRTRSQGLFVADAYALSPALRLNLAARYDQAQTRTRDAVTPGGGPGSLDGNQRFSRLNPALGLIAQANPALSVYGSYSQASRAPSAIELGCADPANPCRLPNAMAGDPPLRQVVTTTWEAGARGTLGAATAWTAALFRASNRDDILFIADDQAGYGYFHNVGQTRREGLELGGNSHLGHLEVGVNYTFLSATYRSAETLHGAANSSNDAVAPGFEGNIQVEPGQHLPLIPQHLFKAYAHWDVNTRLTLDADLMVVGGSYARGNENNQHQPDGLYYLGTGRSGGYGVLNVGAEWRATTQIELFLQVSNLTDRRYATAAQLGATAFNANRGFVARPFADPVIDGERPLLHSTFLAPGAPRSLLLGLRLRLDP